MSSFKNTLLALITFDFLKNITFEQKQTIKKISLKIVNIILWTIGILLLIMCLSNVYQRWFNSSGYTGFFGIGEAVVSSESMEPKINKGDLVFYTKPNIDILELGDTVIYKKQGADGQILVIHDIIKINENTVITQGIANTVADEEFDKNMIVGKYQFRMPQMGRVISVLSAPIAPFLILAIIVVLAFVRIKLYCIKKNKTIAKITLDKPTREAIDYFFDI